jgi:hypothetical protein
MFGRHKAILGQGEAVESQVSSLGFGVADFEMDGEEEVKERENEGSEFLEKGGWNGRARHVEGRELWRDGRDWASSGSDFAQIGWGVEWTGDARRGMGWFFCERKGVDDRHVLLRYLSGTGAYCYT